MILIENFSQVIAQIESERGIDKSVIVEAIRKAIESATKKKYSEDITIDVEINYDNGEAKVWQEKTVVETYSDDNEMNEFFEIYRNLPIRLASKSFLAG